MFVHFILILIIPPSVNRSGQKLGAGILAHFSTKIFFKIPQRDSLKLPQKWRNIFVVLHSTTIHNAKIAYF